MRPHHRSPKDWLVLLTVVLLFGGLAVAHIYVGTQGTDYAGALLFLDHLFDFGVALALLVICTGLGRFALARCNVVFDQPLEALTFATAVGAGIVATSILILGFLSGLYTLSLGLLLVLLAVLARKELGELPALTAQGLNYLKQNSGGRVPLIFGTLVFGAAALFMIILALAPPVDWDALMYHVQVPAQFLQNHRVYLPEDNLHTALVGLVHILYLPLLAVGSSSGPALLNALLALMLGVGVFSLSARFLGGQTGSLSLALLWGTTTVLLVAISPRVDVTLGLYLFLAHYALLKALSDPSDRTHFYLAAVLLGFALGIKYHALLYMLGLAPLMIWVVGSRTRNLTASVGPLVLFGLLVLAAALPWLVKNWILLRAPFHPFLAETTLQPWLIPFFGTHNVPPSVNPEIFQWIWEIRLPFNLRDAFFSPGRLTIELEGTFYHANPALLLLPLWVLFLKNRTLNWLVIPAVGYLLALLISFPLTNLRYLIPAVAPLTIVSVYMAVRSCERFLSAGAARVLLVLLGGLALAPSGKAAYAWLSRTEALGYLIGVSSTEDYLATHLDPTVRQYAPLVRFVNGQLAEDSRILMLFEARGYYLNPSVIQDNQVTNWPLLAPKLAPDTCLEAAGISHVLLGTGALNYYVQGGLDPELIRWKAFQQFAERCLAPIYRGPAFVLFRLRDDYPLAPIR